MRAEPSVITIDPNDDAFWAACQEEFKIVLRGEYDRIEAELNKIVDHPKKLEALRRCMKVYGMKIDAR